MSSIKLVQAFTKEDEEHQRFMGASGESLRATLRLYSWQTLFSAAGNLVIAGGSALVVYAGARAVISGRLSVGQLIVFVSYLAQLYAPINQITQSWGLIAGARVGARRIFDILDTEADLRDGSLGFPPEGARGDVAWRDVSFRYRPETPVLNGIELRVPAGAKIAVIGPTGAGKSTLLGLLPRFFDPSAGVVFSEGEKQRITIARALLRDAPILILDEPTSALDVATEALVMAGIERLVAARTTFIIAHRLSTVRRCDRIVVLRDGTIAEEGTLSELLRRDGVFAEYYRTQFAPERGHA